VSLDSQSNFFTGFASKERSCHLLIALGSILMFTAIHDRCPIWKAITTQFKKVVWK
jgi:hypothetical protein